MSLYDLVALYKGTEIIAPIANGVKGHFLNALLDCNCVDGDCTNCD